MDVESVRATLLKLPHVVETMQWGDNLVYWVGDKAIGGKMFALINLDARNVSTLDSGRPASARAVMSFSAGPERYAELVEQEGVIPAPYMARIYWVALERWNALASADLIRLIKTARELTYNKLPKRTKDVLDLPPIELRKLLSDRKKLLAIKAAEQKTAKKKLTPARTTSKTKPQSGSRKKS